jgi:RHS repeat-associated protein
MMRVYKLKSAIERVYNSPNTSYHLTDGLGSVRGMVNSMSDVLSTTTYSPYGVPDSPINGFAFTGEQRDTNGLQYHRARYYNAGLGTWASLDPFEGIHNRPMSLNGYTWVEGKVMNAIDPTGKIWWEGSIPSITNLVNQNLVTSVVSHAIQIAFAVTTFPSIYHAEYRANAEGTQRTSPAITIDLLKADYTLSQIEIWEIKPNNDAARKVGKEQVVVRMGLINERVTHNIYKDTVYQPQFGPFFTYDWDMFTWKEGTSFPAKVLIGSTSYGPGYTIHWYAGQDDPGLIVYWSETNLELDDRFPEIIPVAIDLRAIDAITTTIKNVPGNSIISPNPWGTATATPVPTRRVIPGPTAVPNPWGTATATPQVIPTATPQVYPPAAFDINPVLFLGGLLCVGALLVVSPGIPDELALFGALVAPFSPK